LSSIAAFVTMSSMSFHLLLQGFLVVSLLAIVRDGLAWLLHCICLSAQLFWLFHCWPL
jgi:hypothetical protein